MAAAALAVAGAGTAAGQIEVPTFDAGTTFTVPDFGHAVAVTPPGEDLLGSSDIQEPDGFAEVAVGGLENGLVRILRNSTTGTGQPVGLENYTQIDVFSQLNFLTGSNFMQLEDIKLVSLTGDAPGEEDPDLLVAVSYVREYEDNGVTVEERRGKVAIFRASRELGSLAFVIVNEVDLDFPATGISAGDYSGDGIPDVLVATDYANFGSSPTPNPARVTVLQNNLRLGSATAFGRLTDAGDLVAAQFDTYPTRNVVSGQFRQLVGGGIGGGGVGNGLDFIAFGNGGGLTLGYGNGVGSNTFDINISNGNPCGSSGIWFGSGVTQGGPAALVAFDPIANRDASLATTVSDHEVSLIHYNTLSGAMYHRCNGTSTLDVYDVKAIDCVTPPQPALSQTHSYVARGKLNSDPYDDLVHTNGAGQDLAFLLGRGTAPAGEPIMLFNPCENSGHFIFNYANGTTSVSGTHFDRVLCADLNNDTYDEIIVTRPGSEWEPFDDTRIIVYTNTTND